MFQKSFASEFPHDNPDLSEGLTWVCTSLGGRPQPQMTGQLMRPERPAAAAVPEPLQPRPLVRVKARVEPPREETPFERFLGAMVRVALSASATHVAAELPAILRDGRLRPATLGPDAERALASRGYLGPERCGASDSFLATQSAWRDALSGSAASLSACESTLDEWGAALLSALLARPASRADELKRALRSHGVAAFGMREAA